MSEKDREKTPTNKQAHQLVKTCFAVASKMRDRESLCAPLIDIARPGHQRPTEGNLEGELLEAEVAEERGLHNQRKGEKSE